MKKITKICVLITLMCLSLWPTAYAQNSPNANPGVLDIALRNPSQTLPQGTVIDGSVVMAIQVANTGNGANSTIPAFALNYQISFNQYYSYASMLAISSSDFQVVSVSNGFPNYSVTITNIVPQPAFYSETIYLNVFATGVTPSGGASMVVNVNRVPGRGVGNSTIINDDALTRVYTTTNPSPLPVKLISFTARKTDDRRAQLNWETAVEENTDYFEVERSSDGKKFNSAIRRMKAAGNTNVKTQYQTYDPSPNNGINYYRLRMVDKNGEYVFSDVRSVTFDDVIRYSVSPNPASDEIVIKGIETGAQIRVTNVTGISVYQAVEQESSKLINISSWATGTYYVQVLVDGELRFTTKLVKK